MQCSSTRVPESLAFSIGIKKYNFEFFLAMRYSINIVFYTTRYPTNKMIMVRRRTLVSSLIVCKRSL